MASERGSWIRRLLGRGSKNGKRVAALTGNGKNGTQVAAANGNGVNALAERSPERETSAIIIQDGIRDLAGLLKGIESKLEIQNNHGQEVWTRLERLGESLRSLPSNSERSEEILQAIQIEVSRHGEMSQEVAEYFRTIPEILRNLESGGTVRQAQLDLARGLVREIATQGQRMVVFQRETAEMHGTVNKLAALGEAQLRCLTDVEKGIRYGFEAAARRQSDALQQWSKRFRWSAILLISFIGLGILAMGGGILYNASTTRGLLDEIRAAQLPAVIEPTVIPVATNEADEAIGTDGTDPTDVTDVPGATIGETIESAAESETPDAEIEPPAGFFYEPIFMWEEF